MPTIQSTWFLQSITYDAHDVYSIARECSMVSYNGEVHIKDISSKLNLATMDMRMTGSELIRAGMISPMGAKKWAFNDVI